MSGDGGINAENGISRPSFKQRAAVSSIHPIGNAKSKPAQAWKPPSCSATRTPSWETKGLVGKLSD